MVYSFLEYRDDLSLPPDLDTSLSLNQCSSPPDFPLFCASPVLGLMANSGQPGGFSGENVREMDLASYPDTGTGDPTSGVSLSAGNHERLRNHITGTQFDNQQFGEHQPARMSDGISSPVEPSSDQANVNFQRSCTFDGQHYGEVAAANVSVMQDSKRTHIDVQTTRTPMTPEQRARKREIDKRYREKKKEKGKELQSELEKLKDENKKLQLLLKDEDLKKLIKEGYKHNKKPTQYPSPSHEERHMVEEISVVNLDGVDSEDENDSKTGKRRVACSASRERHSGKVPDFADVNELMEMRQVSLAAKKEWYDAAAERYGSTSNPITKVDSHSITECLHILKSMGDIPYSIVKKATAKFKSSADEREAFVGLTEDWRKDWVKDLDNDA